MKRLLVVGLVRLGLVIVGLLGAVGTLAAGGGALGRSSSFLFSRGGAAALPDLWPSPSTGLLLIRASTRQPFVARAYAAWRAA